MADSPHAIFLSYASQDAAAARRISDTLRGAGIEVWLDADGGLQHGDEWDAKIRRQIKQCTFFMPMVSANTQSRHEGYFRIEWELAAERAMGFAHNIPFILPIVIDETGEAEALVPERFRKVQWTRSAGGVVSPEVQARFLQLWSERMGGVVTAPARLAHVPTHGRVTASPAADDKSIAVLPFANMSADAENEYFSDGMTEEIINALVQLPDLRVAARTSVFAFKGKADDLRAIAAKLNVRTVLEGSVRKAGNKIRITAQLINAADGFHLWSEKFDRGLEDVFAVQDEIARTIADKLKAKLSVAPGGTLVKPATENMEAYQLYLQGRYFWIKRGAGLFKALEFFHAALERDPNCAPAYAGVADTYSLMALYGHAKPRDVMPKAQFAVERALAIDPEMAGAFCALGHINIFYHHDSRAARAAFENAIRVKPSHVSSYAWGSAAHSAIERIAAGVALAERGVRIEPLSLHANVTYAWNLVFAGQWNESAQVGRHIVNLESRFFPGHWVLGQALICLGRHEEGIEELRMAVEYSNQIPWMVASLGCGLACVGKPDEAQRLLVELTTRSEREYVPAFPRAMLHAHLGDEPAAVDLLAQAMVDGDSALAFLRVDVGPMAPMVIPAAYLNPKTRRTLAERIGLYRE